MGLHSVSLGQQEDTGSCNDTLTLHLFGHVPELEWVFSLPVRA